MGKFSATYKATIAAAVTIAGLAGISFTFTFSGKIDITPEAAKYNGWAGPEVVKQAAPIVAAMPKFAIRGADENNLTKNARLWDATILVHGEHWPNYPQQTGDCVSFGYKNAIQALMCVEAKLALEAILRGDQDAVPKEVCEVFPPHIYGGSRVTIGRGSLGRGAGSVGAWAVDWGKKYGVLRVDTPGCPKYSGSLADQWGIRGVPKEFTEASRVYLIETASPVRSADDAMDALCNGYPVTIASDAGFGSISEVNGRRVGRRTTTWNHQMCLLAYDGSANGKRYFYVLNSWGASAHPAPLQGEPPGGFWIEAKDVDYIARQGDSFAISNFSGFPAQEIDFSAWNKQASLMRAGKSQIQVARKVNHAKRNVDATFAVAP